MRKRFYNTLFIGFIGLAACTNSQTQESTSVSETAIINTALDVSAYEQKLNETKDAQLIDVRTPQEFEQGHLAGALNYNINSSDFESQINTLDKNKPVFVYCLSGGRSANAASIMEDKGFKEVYNMQGGIMKWDAAGKPLNNNNTATQERKGMSIEEYNKLTLQKEYVLVDFNAKWCKPCQKMAPWLEELAQKKKDKLVLVKIDADENKDLLKELKIDAIPVLEIYKNGKSIWKHEGETDEATLVKESGI